MTGPAGGRDWPDGVTPIGIEDLGRIGINADNELFWDGRRVEIRRTLVLTAPQKAVAVLAVMATLATIATGLNNATVFLCARDIHWLSCPAVRP